MQPAQVTITFDPATNNIQVQSNTSPGDSLLLLERAKVLVMNQAFQAKSPIQQASPDIERALLNHGRR